MTKLGRSPLSGIGFSKLIKLPSLIDPMHPLLRSELIDQRKSEDALKIQELLDDVYCHKS